MTENSNSLIDGLLCGKCNNEKPLADFHKCTTNYAKEKRQGKAYWCKACYLQYSEERKTERKAAKRQTSEGTDNA